MEKKARREIPITISGMTSGTYSIESTTLFPLNLYLYIPIAAKVPIITESIVLIAAIVKEFLTASKIPALWKRLSYHLKVKPVQTTFNFDWLKENAISTIMGIYKNINTKSKYINFIELIFLLFILKTPP